MRAAMAACDSGPTRWYRPTMAASVSDRQRCWRWHATRVTDMHELSIAMALVEIATEEAERRGARVLAAHVKLGMLSGVVKEALMSAYEMASAGSPLEGTALVIDEIPAVIYCAVCQQDRATRPDE